jgi:predicted AAA+ superfamily ATPase
MGHPVIGASWEAFVIENLLSVLPIGTAAWYYRTLAGAEIDLVIEKNSIGRYAIEIKRCAAPVLSKGFYLGCHDIGATRKFLVYPGKEKYLVSKEVIAMPLLEMMIQLQGLNT